MSISNTSIQLARHLEKITLWSGQLIAWLTLLMVFVTFSIVILRYGFQTGWIAMQESVVYMHALVFLIGIPYTLKYDGHVRVDIFYSKMSPRGKALVNLLGTLLLLFPVTLFIAWSSWDFVIASWEMGEESGEAGGLPGVYLLKSSILLMTLLLFIQGISHCLFNISYLMKPSNFQKVSDNRDHL
ncbi:MAG: TRAP transporter small permease subunit [gamma proteobacterium symbiont of Taylorina sp.]|nr:TRAP transporter small permease subunit [gamma proteobacterium symbiont of Taylorina sp.]